MMMSESADTRANIAAAAWQENEKRDPAGAREGDRSSMGYEITTEIPVFVHVQKQSYKYLLSRILASSAP